jgi:hypothetical protein
VTWLWSNDLFTFEERVLHGIAAQEEELERFVNRDAPCPAWRRTMEGTHSWAHAGPHRIARKAR